MAWKHQWTLEQRRKYMEEKSARSQEKWLKDRDLAALRQHEREVAEAEEWVARLQEIGFHIDYPEKWPPPVRDWRYSKRKEV